MKIFFSILSLSVLVFFYSPAFGEEKTKGMRKLTVTAVHGEGACFLDGEWVKVKGDHVYWVKDGANSWKRHNRFRPINENYRPSSGLASQPYFQIYIELEKVRKRNPEYYRNLSVYKDEIAFAEKLSQLSGKDLMAAVFVQGVTEDELHRLNSDSDAYPFQKWGKKVINIPTRYSACEMQLTYLMDEATAYYRKKFFGGVEIIKDETVPYGRSPMTIAEQILKN